MKKIKIEGFEEVVLNNNGHFLHLLPKSIIRDSRGNIIISWFDENGFKRRESIYPRYDAKVLTWDEEGKSI